MEEIKVIKQDAFSMVASERAAIDSQIATAKAYPRDLMRIKDNCIAIVSMDQETAISCRYAKPQGGTNITGESVHLARILAQQYGNIRVQQRIREVSATEIVAEAIAFDLETNYAVSVEARRSIVTKQGKRYQDHMINTTSMAALAIAERNAILKVIPKGLIKATYNAAFKTANGDLSSEQQVLAAKEKAFQYLHKKYAAKEEDILYALGLRSATQIDAEQVANLRTLTQSLIDKELTANELFGWNKETESPNPLGDKPQPQPQSEPDTLKMEGSK